MDNVSQEVRSKIMRSVHTKNTAQEIQVRSWIHRAGFRFSLHGVDLPGTPDVVLPRYRVAVFVHGCFWHAHKCPRGRRPRSNIDFWNRKLQRNRKRDRRSRLLLQDLGWRVFVVWGCRLHEDTQQLIAHLRRRRSFAAGRQQAGFSRK
ncbi:MAG: very short patch repair endonuclease [Steroidobacter sp.]